MEVIQLVPQERNSDRKTKEIKCIITSAVMKEMDELVKLIPQVGQSFPEGRIQERMSEEFVDASIPQVMEDSFGAVKRIRQEQCQNRTVEQTEDTTSAQQLVFLLLN